MQYEIQMLRIAFWWESAAKTIGPFGLNLTWPSEILHSLEVTRNFIFNKHVAIPVQSGVSFDCLPQISKAFQRCGIGLVGLIQFLSLWRSTLM